MTVSPLKRKWRAAMDGFWQLPAVRKAGAGRSCGAILMYHRVLPAVRADAEWDFNAGLTTGLERFDQQMAYLARRHEVISLDAVPRRRKDRGRFFVAVTFDDGYRDNMIHALPVLEKYRLPAAVYVATRFPDGDHRMWWYELADICRRRDAVAIRWRGRRRRWHLAGPAAKRRGFHAMQALMLSLPEARRDALMSRIRGADPAATYPEHCLSWDDIRRLSRHPLITIGAHTCSHARLRELPRDAAEKEIRGSKARIEAEIGIPVRHFSYPYGSLNNFGEREVAMASRAGYATAVSGQCAHVTPDAPLHRLPRIPVTDGDDPRRLASKLSGMNALYGAVNTARAIVKG